jgi:elongation factor Ts
MKITADKIRNLRNKTGAPVMRVKRVLEDFDGDEKKAETLLKKEGFEKISKRQGRETSQGIIVCYEHHSKKVASMVELLCETDFVARNEIFTDLAHNLAMQVASMNPKNPDELLKQDFIKDPSKKVSELVGEAIAKTGENIRIGRIYRVELGK